MEKELLKALTKTEIKSRRNMNNEDTDLTTINEKKPFRLLYFKDDCN